MKTIKIFFMTAFVLFATVASAQKKVVMTAEDVNIKVGEQSDLVISMDYETDVPVVGWNIYLSLPEGIDLYYDEDEEDYVYEVSSALHKKALRNGFGIKATTEARTYLLYCIDNNNMTPMTKTTGELLTITLVASNNAHEKLEGTLKDIALTDKDNNSLDLGNIEDYDFEINVIGGISTGIREIPNYDTSSNAVYNLNGQRVENAGKGIYIINGVKRVIK